MPPITVGGICTAGIRDCSFSYCPEPRVCNHVPAVGQPPCCFSSTSSSRKASRIASSDCIGGPRGRKSERRRSERAKAGCWREIRAWEYVGKVRQSASIFIPCYYRDNQSDMVPVRVSIQYPNMFSTQVCPALSAACTGMGRKYILLSQQSLQQDRRQSQHTADI